MTIGLLVLLPEAGLNRADQGGRAGVVQVLPDVVDHIAERDAAFRVSEAK
jgi:hypothetical protein